MPKEIKSVTAYEFDGTVYQSLHEAERAKIELDIGNALQGYFIYGQYQIDTSSQILDAIEEAGCTIIQQGKTKC